MKDQNVSIICTTFNEEATILQLLESLTAQTVEPSEIILCDAQSSDSTHNIIKEFSETHKKVAIKLLSKQGNRSIGRNAAISAAKTHLIAITDAGCVPEKNWLEKLLKKYHQSGSPVIAGYYKGLPKTLFEEAVVPYMLVMPDQVNPEEFLPATRSLLLEKKVWEELGGFDEKLSLNEDYPFAKKIQKAGISISFAKDAVVGWMPRKNLSQFEVMVEKFALGDIAAGIVRPKVVFLFVRYIGAVSIVLILFINQSLLYSIIFCLVAAVLYALWAVLKNKKYVAKGWYWLPVLQYVADFAVIKGSIKGLLYR